MIAMCGSRFKGPAQEPSELEAPNRGPRRSVDSGKNCTSGQKTDREDTLQPVERSLRRQGKRLQWLRPPVLSRSNRCDLLPACPENKIAMARGYEAASVDRLSGSARIACL